MAGVRADNPKSPASLHVAAMNTDLFYGGFHFHVKTFKSVGRSALCRRTDRGAIAHDRRPALLYGADAFFRRGMRVPPHRYQALREKGCSEAPRRRSPP